MRLTDVSLEDAMSVDETIADEEKSMNAILGKVIKDTLCFACGQEEINWLRV